MSYQVRGNKYKGVGMSLGVRILGCEGIWVGVLIPQYTGVGR